MDRSGHLADLDRTDERTAEIFIGKPTQVELGTAHPSGTRDAHYRPIGLGRSREEAYFHELDRRNIARLREAMTSTAPIGDSNESAISGTPSLEPVQDNAGGIAKRIRSLLAWMRS